jgi:hypothetical protein
LHWTLSITSLPVLGQALAHARKPVRQAVIAGRASVRAVLRQRKAVTWAPSMHWSIAPSSPA